MSEQTKLRTLLFGLWLLLLLPTLFLGYQTYQRLQFEALHQYRTLAETLTDGIASSLGLAMQQESARDPAEYGFALGDNRSPLSLLTPTSGMPGIVGYFQVDAQGELSSPVMPTGAELGGISVEELALRQLKLQSIENALLLNLPEPSLTALADADSAREREAQAEIVDQVESRLDVAKDVAEDSALAARAPMAVVPKRQMANLQRNQVLYEELAQAEKPSGKSQDRKESSAARDLKLETDFFSRSNEAQTQQAAKQRAKVAQEKLGKTKIAPPSATQAIVSGSAAQTFGDGNSSGVAPNQPAPSEGRFAYRVGARVGDSVEAKGDTQVGEKVGEKDAAKGGATGEIRVEASLFGSTVTEFSLRPLSDDHLLLFRRVWQSAQPLVQGLVLDRQQFFAGAVTNAYGGSALAAVSDLAVAVDGQVQLTLAAGSAGYSAGALLSGGELLYRRYLGSPFGNVELLFSARELPLAAGASLVLWTLLVLVSLLCAGFVLLYILGRRQLQQRQQQQDFVSAVSHELKTPLTSIRMYGEMLKSGWVDEAKKPEYYDYIFNESERLSRLISNVLQLSSITRGRSDLQLGPLSVAQILDLVRSRSAAQVKAQDYQLKITCDSSLEPAELEVDEDALLQVMINLIDNGLKFSQGCERKELLLNVARDGNEIVFSLRDYGPGIERGQLDKIFELFYRSESELTRETVGTGIGLALVQELVGAMGGRIAARNCEPGAEFMVRLPG